MILICQTASVESKLVSMNEANSQNLGKMQTASAQAIKISLTLYHYAISQTVSAESEPTFKELKFNYLRNATRIRRVLSDPCTSASSAKSVFHSIPSAFVGVHSLLNRMALPDEKMLAAELDRTCRMLEERRPGAGR